MQKRMGNLMFRMMTAEFRVKSVFSDLRTSLEHAGVRTGMVVLDFGCGPGRYTIPAARIVGPTGKVYALDVHPLAIRSIERSARRSGLDHIETLLSDGEIPLPDRSVDLVILYDTLHDVVDRDRALGEIMRVLKTGGLLTFRDHRLQAEEAFRAMLDAGRLTKRHEEGPTTTLIRSADV